MIEDGLEIVVLARETRERNAAVGPARAPGRDREHLEIGARRNTPESVLALRRDQAFRVRPDDARDAGAVRPLRPGFILRHQEEFLRHIAREQRVSEIDPGVDEPDRHAGAGRRA